MVGTSPEVLNFNSYCSNLTGSSVTTNCRFSPTIVFEMLTKGGFTVDFKSKKLGESKTSPHQGMDRENRLLGTVELVESEK